MVYVRLFVLMSITILILLGAVEVTTYYAYAQHTRRDGEGDLLTQLPEAERAYHMWHFSRGSIRGREFAFDTLADDTGQSVYFVIEDYQQNGWIATRALPLSAELLNHAARSNGFHVLYAKGIPYRVYTSPVVGQGYGGTIYIYQSIAREMQSLGDMASILWVAGAAGGAVALMLNLWLARRALAPARVTWKAQQEMLVLLSHELKTPLATIAAIATSRRRQPASASKSGQAPVDDPLLSEIGHASNLVEEILYLAKLQSVVSDAAEPIAVSDVTEDTIRRFYPLAEAKRMTLCGEAEGGLFIMSTMERWSHLVSILCKNAIQHGLAGTEVKWRLTADLTTVTLTLENYMEDARKAGDGVVSGVGLQIARRLVEDMRGRLSTRRVDNLLTTQVTVGRKNR